MTTARSFGTGAVTQSGTKRSGRNFSDPSRARSVPPAFSAAAALATGILIGDLVPLSPGRFLWVAMVWLTASALLIRTAGAGKICFLMLIVALGICRWQLNRQAFEYDRAQLSDLNGRLVDVSATVLSIPTAHVRPADALSSGHESRDWQTRFEVRMNTGSSDQSSRCSARCLVYVKGDAATRLAMGDHIRFTGRFDFPATVGNPGEFDFRRFLSRRGISGQLFVERPEVVQVLSPVSRLHPYYWLTWTRRRFHATLVSALPSEVQGVAVALLLGDRHQIPGETERAFVASGTMHLLAISGLHVGIMCLFLLQCLHVLVVRRKTALLLTLIVCIAYAFMTNLRPSVVRATVFFAIFVMAEWSHRRADTASLLSVTALVMLIWQPRLVYDSGAWLSFLSVFALGLVDRNRVLPPAEDAAPVALTPREHALQWLSKARQWLTYRYAQMLAVLALTAPLIAWQFHVVSPVGLLVNVLLIPATACILCLGFVTLGCGLLLPAAAVVVGSLFGASLSALTGIVQVSAAFNAGHTYLADFSPLLVVLYYALIAGSLFAPALMWRRFAAMAVPCCAVAALMFPVTSPVAGGLRCTVLDVGHGSAALLEFSDGRVMLVDAGAMNRGSRAADIVCRCLWSHGHRVLHTLVISHADVDHFNAVPEILARVPVGEVVTSHQFVRSESAAARELIAYLQEQSIRVRIASSGDTATAGDAEIRIFQATDLQDTAEDNETSLVVAVEMAGRRIVLPGDLEGPAADDVYRSVGPCDVLVSPHHGSAKSNLPEVACTLKPAHVIVSARDTSSAAHVQRVYQTAQSLRLTSESGAVSVQIGREGGICVDEFRRPVGCSPELPSG